jgi:hypothetical protein
MASLRDRLRAAARPQAAGARSSSATASDGQRPLPPPSTAVVVPRQATVPEAVWRQGLPVTEQGVADHREAVALRRERRALAARYDQLQRDIGGLAIEMARQANYNYPLLRARSDEALRVEARVAEIDLWLESAVARRRLDRVRQRAPQPALPMLVEASLPPATLECPRCAQPVAVEANFCPWCGATVG